MNATLTHDPDVNAFYIQLPDADVAETVELAKWVFLDIDAGGQAVGFEILNTDAGLLASIPTLPESADLASLLRGRAAQDWRPAFTRRISRRLAASF